ncbi:MAG: hypothetical protein ACYTGQ_05705 [Planctomycetota bacterium]
MAIVRSYHLFESDLQQTVVEYADRLDGALRAIFEEGDPQDRINGMTLLVESRSYRLSYLLSTSLRDAEVGVSRQAAAGLAQLADNLMNEIGDPDPHGDRSVSGKENTDSSMRVLTIRQMVSAATEAVSSYHKHRRRDALLTGARLMELTPHRLRELLGERKSEGRIGVDALLRRLDHPVVTRSLLRFASIRDLQGAVIEALGKPAARARLNELLDGGHLVVVPGIRRVARRVVGAQHLLPWPNEVAMLAPTPRRRLGRWVETVNAPPAERLRVLIEMTASDERMTRLMGVRGLIKLDSDESCVALAGVCFDTDEGLSRLALRRLISVDWPGLSGLVLKLVGSPHDSVRALAERHLSPLGFRRLWKHWDAMDSKTQEAAGRALIRLEPRFHRMLAREMDSGDASDRLRAVMMARRLNQESYYEAGLIRLLGDDSARVASAAASALGTLRGGDQGRLEKALASGLGHTDDRVRANAVESLDRLGLAYANRVELELLFKRGGARSRANAVRALLGAPLPSGSVRTMSSQATSDSIARSGYREAASNQLIQMMLDTDARRRASALWVVEDLGLRWAARQVATLARHDRDPAVRRRAVGVMRGLAAVNRSAEWAPDGAVLEVRVETETR